MTLALAGAKPGERLVGIHPGGRYPTQRYPSDLLADVARTLAARPGLRVVLLGAEGDQSLLAPLRAVLGASAIDPGPLPPRQMISILGCLDAFACNNSGPLHAASALGIPTVSTLGPTEPAPFAPRGTRDRTLALDLWCRPCNRGECPLGTHACLRGIPPEGFLREALALLYP